MRSVFASPRLAWVAIAPLTLAGLVTLLVPAAQARTAAGPAGRLVRAQDSAVGADVAVGEVGDVAGAREPDAPSLASSSVPAPLAAGGVVIDSTWYDLQDMGSLGTRIVVAPDGRVHVTYQKDFCELGGGCPPNLNAPQPHPNRAMGYAYRDAGGTWNRRGKVQDPRLRGCCGIDLLGGFGSLAITAAGHAVVAQHMNEDGCDLRGDFYLADDPVATTWKGYLSPIQSPSNLFPQVATMPNGSFALVGEVPRAGSYDEVESFAVSYLAASGGTFLCPVGWQNGPWTAVASASLFRDGRPAFPSIASAADGRAGIAVGDFGGNVRLFESSNGSFQPGTVVVRTLTSNTDASITAPDSTSSQWRPYVHCHLAYNDTTPHVVWSELQARRVGGNIQYVDHRSRIRHWSPDRGLETVYQVPAGLADRYDDVDQGLAGPLAGFNTLSVDWPQVGFSASGQETIVAFLSYRDGDVDPTADAGLPGIVTGIGFGDIEACVAHTSEAWSIAQNLTNTPHADERFFSLAARNPGGRAHLVYQTSAFQDAGVALIGDRGTAPGNVLHRIVYLERMLSLVAVVPAPGVDATLGVMSNPARGIVRFRRDNTGATTSLVVLDATGRRVGRVAMDAGASVVTWDGKDEQGRRVPPGVYFARAQDGAPGSSVRFILLP